MINSVLPFSLFAWGAERAPAGIGAITNSTAVLFTALVAFVAFEERVGPRRWTALLIGLTGVMVLAAGRTAGEGVFQASVAWTVAALCYGIAANLIRGLRTALPPVAVAAVTLLWSALLMAPAAIATWPKQPISRAAWSCAALVGVLCTGVAYALYFRLIRRTGATRATAVGYLTPLFGVRWAWLILDEPLTMEMAMAGVMILGSMFLSRLAPDRSSEQSAGAENTQLTVGT